MKKIRNLSFFAVFCIVAGIAISSYQPDNVQGQKEEVQKPDVSVFAGKILEILELAGSEQTDTVITTHVNTSKYYKFVVPVINKGVWQQTQTNVISERRIFVLKAGGKNVTVTATGDTLFCKMILSILSVEEMPDQYYCSHKGIWTPAEVAKLQSNAKNKAVDISLSKGILEKARENIIEKLTLFNKDRGVFIVVEFL
jgi:hypothetical protein